MGYYEADVWTFCHGCYTLVGKYKFVVLGRVKGVLRTRDYIFGDILYLITDVHQIV